MFRNTETKNMPSNPAEFLKLHACFPLKAQAKDSGFITTAFWNWPITGAFVAFTRICIFLGASPGTVILTTATFGVFATNMFVLVGTIL